MKDLILTCNAGSNSLKCALFEADSLRLLYMFIADRIHENTHVILKNATGEMLSEEGIEPGYENALKFLLHWKDKEIADHNIVAAGHRVVHGGLEFADTTKITPEVLASLEQLIPLAPLHQPYNLKLIDVLKENIPDLVQTASFDTAFHQSQPWAAHQFALPRELVEAEGLYRYGFHGLSYDYIAGILPDHLENADTKKVIILHLGSGASACAMQDGKSIATTMGFTALDGLMMSKRCGQLDPGILLYLLREKNMDADEVENLLYKKSGLLGVSGISADMRDLENNPSKSAREAIELFCYKAVYQIGGLIAALGGIDALVFTGAMGKHDPIIRKRIYDSLTWLPLKVDEAANKSNQDRISVPESTVNVLALETDEEAVIARQTRDTLNL